MRTAPALREGPRAARSGARSTHGRAAPSGSHRAVRRDPRRRSRAETYTATLEQGLRGLVVTAAVLAALTAAPLASAGVILGVHGNAGRFAAQTGQESQIRHTFMSFDQGGNLPQI